MFDSKMFNVERKCWHSAVSCVFPFSSEDRNIAIRLDGCFIYNCITLFIVRDRSEMILSNWQYDVCMGDIVKLRRHCRERTRSPLPPPLPTNRERICALAIWPADQNSLPLLTVSFNRTQRLSFPQGLVTKFRACDSRSAPLKNNLITNRCLFGIPILTLD